jgi:hypothetical protein
VLIGYTGMASIDKYIDRCVLIVEGHEYLGTASGVPGPLYRLRRDGIATRGRFGHEAKGYAEAGRDPWHLGVEIAFFGVLHT